MNRTCTKSPSRQCRFKARPRASHGGFRRPELESRPESTATRASEFADLLQAQACHIIQPDLVYSGGFMENEEDRRHGRGRLCRCGAT